MAKEHVGWVIAVAVSADGRWIASAGHDSQVLLWNAVDGKLRRKFEGHRDRIGSLAFSPDSHRLASGGFDKTVKIWDLDSGEELLSVANSRERPRAGVRCLTAKSWPPQAKTASSAFGRRRRV